MRASCFSSLTKRIFAFSPWRRHAHLSRSLCMLRQRADSGGDYNETNARSPRSTCCGRHGYCSRNMLPPALATAPGPSRNCSTSSTAKIPSKLLTRLEDASGRRGEYARRKLRSFEFAAAELICGRSRILAIGSLIARHAAAFQLTDSDLFPQTLSIETLSNGLSNVVGATPCASRSYR